MKLDSLSYPEMYQMSGNEIEALHGFAQNTTGDILEIGMGGSTLMLLDIFEGTNRNLTSIDIKDKLAPIRDELPEDYLKNHTFIQEMSNNVVFHPKRKFQTMFVDGNHDYEWVRNDVVRFWHHIDHFILFHDYCVSFSGVVDFVRELVDSGFVEVIGQEETLLLTRKIDYESY